MEDFNVQILQISRVDTEKVFSKCNNVGKCSLKHFQTQKLHKNKEMKNPLEFAVVWQFSGDLCIPS